MQRKSWESWRLFLGTEKLARAVNHAPLIHLLLEGPTQSLKGMPAHVHTQIKVFVKGGQQCTREGKRKWDGGPICQSTAALELNRDFSEVLTPCCHHINIMMINVNWLFKRPSLVKNSWLTSAIKCFITMFMSIEKQCLVFNRDSKAYSEPNSPRTHWKSNLNL